MEAGSVDKLANLAAVPLWYGLGLAACAVLLLLYQVSKSCIAGIKKGIVYMYGCVHLHSPLRLGIIGTTTRGRFVAWGLFVIANGVGMCLGPNNTTAWLVRSARMASMNFFLVACGGKLNYLGYVLGAPYSLAEALHKWAGYIGIVQATVHASIAIALKKPQDLWTDAGFLTVAGLVALAVLLSLKNKMYETHRFIHIALAIFIFRGFWVHSWEHLRPQYPITCISLWGSGFLLTKAMQLYRMAVGTGYAHIHVTHFQGAIQLRVETRRPSEFLPGQFFYLCMPRAHPFAFLQSHPFIIAWWDGISGEGTKTVYLLIQPRRGFTSRLLMLGHAISYRGFLEGPYGKRLRLDDYGTVIILASGIGIAGVLPYIKDLLLGFNASKAKIKRLHLIWILSAEAEETWVKPWMDELLGEDRAYILKVSMYVPNGWSSPDAIAGRTVNIGEHARISKTYTNPDTTAILETELNNKKGRAILICCANESLEMDARSLISKRQHSDVIFRTVELKPFSTRAPLLKTSDQHE